MRYKKIKDICNVTKGTTGIMKAISGDYPMVTLADERKTNNEYQFDDKAVIIPLVSSTGHGHASMKRIHYQEGKFALGTILCALTPKNENEYNPLYLFHYLDINKENVFVPLMKGMANVSLPMNRIKDVEIPLPPIETQNKLVKIFESAYDIKNGLDNQILTQKETVKKLREKILELAVKGDLTNKWRDENQHLINEDGKQLLEKIKTEKEQLIKDGKLKRQKPLPKITDDEIPFEVPESWVWTRLGEFVRISSGDGLTSKEMIAGNYPVFGGNGINGHHNQYNTEEETIVIGRVGAYCGSIHLTPKKAWITDNAFFTFFDKQNIDTAYFIWNLRFLNLGQVAFSGAQPVISGKKIYPLVTLLPPLAEQKAIVEKIEKLLSWCDELEAKIDNSEQLNGLLMQTVVKEYA